MQSSGFGRDSTRSSGGEVAAAIARENCELTVGRHVVHDPINASLTTTGGALRYARGIASETRKRQFVRIFLSLHTLRSKMRSLPLLVNY